MVLLQKYGFVVPENPFDTVYIDHHLALESIQASPPDRLELASLSQTLPSPHAGPWGGEAAGNRKTARLSLRGDRHGGVC